MNYFSIDTARRALAFVSSDDRDVWVRVGMALKDEFGDEAFEAWDSWSAQSDKYDAKAVKQSWRGFKIGGKVGIGSLIHEAQTRGFVMEKEDSAPTAEQLAERARLREERLVKQAKEEAARVVRAAAAAKRAQSQWRMAAQTGESPYLLRKLIRGESCRYLADGAIIVPMLRMHNDHQIIVGKQQINADGTKKYSANMDKSAAMVCLGGASTANEGCIYLCEGYATGGSIRLALGYESPVYVCFDSGNLLSCAKALRAMLPTKTFIFCADDDYLTGGDGVRKARAAADAVGHAFVFVPTFSAPRRLVKTDESLPMLTDCNDLHVAQGVEVLAAQLMAFLETPIVPALDEAVVMPPEFPVELIDNSPRPLSSVAQQVDEAFCDATLLFRYSLIYGTTDIWDGLKKQKLKRSAFDAFVGKASAKLWFDNPKKKFIQKEALRALIDGAAVDEGAGGGGIKEMIDNLTLLRGTETVWDMIGRQVMSLGAVRANYTSDLTSKWQERVDRKTVEAKNLVFDPTQTVNLDTHVNIFFGWPLVPKENAALIGPIILLIESLCSSEDDTETILNFILCWLALPLQRPGAKMQTALLIFGEKQGTGKSLLFDSIIRPLYGEYGTTVGQHQLESGFTDWRSRKLFALFEEVLSRDDKFSHNGTLKHMITGKSMQVNPKNLPLREEANHMNCVFLSNEPQPIPIELEDRRFLVVQARKKQNEEFYQDVIESITHGGIEAFYQFLLDYPLNNFSEHTKPPMTRAKERVIAFGRSSWDAFHCTWRDGYLDAPYQSCLTSDLYIIYKRWCDRNGEKPLSQTKFSGYLDARETKVKRDVALGSKIKKSYMVFEIEDETGRSLHEQCTEFREKADVYGLGN